MAKISKREDVNPKEGVSKYGDVQFADAKNKKYPIDTPEHIRAAWNYINKEANAAKYDPDEVATIKNRIVAAWKRKIDKAGPPSSGKATADGDSIEENLQDLREDFNDQFNPSPMMEMPPMPYIMESYADYVIVCDGEDYYKVPFETDAASGEFTFADRSTWEPVEQQWTPAPSDVDSMKHLKAGARHNKRDQAVVQDMHDAAVQLGADCQTPSDMGMKTVEIDEANHLKAISKTENEIRAANYIVLFGGRDLTAFKFLGNKVPRFTNPDGSAGEFFSKSVDLTSDYTETGVLPINWEHGQDPDGTGVDEDELLGYVDWKTAKVDEKGVFVERVLNRRKKYIQWLEDLIDAGLVGTSTEPVQKNVEIKSNGEIVRWGLKKDTLTVTPMEPRMMQENVLKAYKALGLLQEVPEQSDNSQASDEPAGQVKSESATQPEKPKSIGVATMDITEEKLQELITQASEAGAKKAITALEPVKSAGVQVTLDEADREFKTIAEQAIAVKNFEVSRGRVEDPRLKRLSMKAVQGASEVVPADGGALLEPTLSAMVVKNIHDVGPFSQDIQMLPVSSNSNSGWINGVDETSRVAGSRWGGVQGYRLAEGASITKSKPTFRRIQWELKKYGALVYGTDELLADSAMFSSIVDQACREELAFMVNDDIMNGVGVSGAQGFMNSGALITAQRDSGSKVLGTDISLMWQNLTPTSKAKAKWYIHVEVAPQLDGLFAVGSTAVLFPYAGYRPDGVRTLYGRPVVETEFNQALNTTGDIVLADMSAYLGWEKGGVQAASSVHVEFLTDQEVFRFTYRFDGKSAYASALTNYHGSGKTSPFVALTTAT